MKDDTNRIRSFKAKQRQARRDYPLAGRKVLPLVYHTYQTSRKILERQYPDDGEGFAYEDGKLRERLGLPLNIDNVEAIKKRDQEHLSLLLSASETF